MNSRSPAETDGGTATDTAGPEAAGTDDDAPNDVGSSDAAAIVGDANGVVVDSAPPPSDAPVTCTGGQIACAGVCIDPATDPANCGGCGTICSSGLCGVTIAADMTEQPSSWNFNGSAVWNPAGPSAEMTAASAPGVAGTVIYANPIITDSFTASFQFRMGENGGGRYDGMGFMLEVTGATAVGSANSQLGMGNLGGYGVEFDVYDNGECGDVSDDQIGIDLLEPCMTSMPTSLFASPDLTGKIDIADAQWHMTSVELAGGAMYITVNGLAIANSVALTGFVSGTSYYFGFSGGTGGIAPNGGIQTEAKDVTITFPTPRCL